MLESLEAIAEVEEEVNGEETDQTLATIKTEISMMKASKWSEKTVIKEEEVELDIVEETTEEEAEVKEVIEEEEAVEEEEVNTEEENTGEEATEAREATEEAIGQKMEEKHIQPTEPLQKMFLLVLQMAKPRMKTKTERAKERHHSLLDQRL